MTSLTGQARRHTEAKAGYGAWILIWGVYATIFLALDQFVLGTLYGAATVLAEVYLVMLVQCSSGPAIILAASLPPGRNDARQGLHMH